MCQQFGHPSCRTGHGADRELGGGGSALYREDDVHGFDGAYFRHQFAGAGAQHAASSNDDDQAIPDIQAPLPEGCARLARKENPHRAHRVDFVLRYPLQRPPDEAHP